MKPFQTGTPESVGISSGTIQAFLDRAEEEGIELHGFSVYRYGKLCASGAFAPYKEETLHLMYSSTKSVVSIAIGFAEQEGKLKLSEKIADLFSEELKGVDLDRNPNLKEATIESLLTMSCGHHELVNPYQEHWIRAFFEQYAPSRPGKHFLYSNPGVNLLVAVLKKKTGMNMVEYLRPRLLEPLEMEAGIHCDALQDGTEIGGGGLFWSLADFSRFALFLLNRGRIGDKQLLNEGWFDRACTEQIRTGDSPDAEGYGYLIWMGRAENAYECRGMLGQYAVILPGQDAFVVTTANGSLFPEAGNNQERIVDLIYDVLVNGMEEKPLPEDRESYLLLQDRIGKLSLPALPYSWSDMENKLRGKVYRTGTPLTAAAFLGYEFLNKSPLHQLHFSELSFCTKQDRLELILHAEETLMIPLGKKGNFLTSDVCGETSAACARWRSRRCMELEIRLLEGILGIRYLLRFDPDGNSFVVEADPIQAFGFSAGSVDADQWIFEAVKG